MSIFRKFRQAGKTYFGVEDWAIRADSVVAAGEKLCSMICNVERGPWAPEMVQYRNTTQIVVRLPFGFGVYTPNEDGTLRCISSVEDATAAQTGRLDLDAMREQIVRKARCHIAQIEWKPEDGETVPPILTHPADIAEYLSWVRWQTRYQWLISQGYTDVEARRMAFTPKESAPVA